jgi:prepilin-type N-terminal cleavage/methylation domain-containing protein
MDKQNRAFTLIELLVVIAIIGLLSSIVLASLNTAREKGANAARISDVKSLETAMELYYDDHGTYPQVGTAGWGYPIANLAPYLVSGGYIPSVPDQLITDSDSYVWGTDAYGLLIEINNSSCKTGVNVNSGWWTGSGICSF